MNKDIAYFVTWCIENFKNEKNLCGQEAMEQLDQYGILQYLADNYEVLHTQSPQWIMEEITDLLNKTKKEL